jgi:hypothetical protein
MTSRRAFWICAPFAVAAFIVLMIGLGRISRHARVNVIRWGQRPTVVEPDKEPSP